MISHHFICHGLSHLWFRFKFRLSINVTK